MWQIFYIPAPFILILSRMKGVQALTVYELLFPPDCKYKGDVHLAVLTRNKEFKVLGSCTFDKLGQKIEKLDILQSCNYYITANTTARHRSRAEKNLFSINNIVLDFDIHTRMNQHDREELLEAFVWYLKRDLFYNTSGLSPNVIHYTGRGVQLWWHIEEASGKLDFLYRLVVGLLLDRISDLLNEYPTLQKAIEVDRVASKNIIGLYRLFDTYNTHTRTKTQTEILHYNSYDLNTLYQLLDKDTENAPEVDRIAPELPKETPASEPAPEKKERKKRSVRHTNYLGLHRKRLFIIRSIVEQEGVYIGKRDIMLFLAYNSAIQIMPINEAKLFCKELNEQFETPLKSLEYIYKEFEDGKSYQFKNETFYEWLDISENEQTLFDREYRLKRETSETIRIQKNKEKRNQKKQLARQMLAEGRSYKEVAEATGLSQSSIYRVSAQTDKAAAQKEWEKLGISRATYYRRKKQPNN